jgi:predicted dehydrogenase
MSELGIGLVGSGFMGRCHAIALASAGRVFNLPHRPRFEMLADVTESAAAASAGALGFARATADWRELVADPRVDVVHITAPNELHLPIALAAIAAGKPVHCEKPLALNAPDARRLADVAEAAGVTTIVGFNYLKNPIQQLAKEIIESGEIGEPIGFRGIHAEDYMLDPAAPYSWRHETLGGGVLMDLGSHIVSLARFLLGEISRVNARSRTVIARRLDGSGAERRVEVDNWSDVLVEFANGVTGSLQASWLSAGRSMQLAYEVSGSRGTLSFTQERLNELRLYRTDADPRTAGVSTIVAGPEHPPYAAFCPAPGHQLGFNDLKAIEIRDFLVAVAEGRSASPDFRQAAKIQAVIDAALRSAKSRQWEEVPADNGPTTP